MSEERDDYMRRQEQDHDLLRMRSYKQPALAAQPAPDDLVARLREAGAPHDRMLYAEAAAAIVELRERVAELERGMKIQAAAALNGMNAAKRISVGQLAEAKKLQAESSPDALESERAANALLTERAERAEADNAKLRERVALADRAYGRAFARAREAGAEVARLTQELAAFKHTDKVYANHVAKIEADNAKLRERVAELEMVLTQAEHFARDASINQQRAEADNAKLRACVAAADGMRPYADNGHVTPQQEIDVAAYDAARAALGDKP
jgi:chromosome segregation ATPase